MGFNSFYGFIFFSILLTYLEERTPSVQREPGPGVDWPEAGRALAGLFKSTVKWITFAVLAVVGFVYAYRGLNWLLLNYVIADYIFFGGLAVMTFMSLTEKPRGKKIA